MNNISNWQAIVVIISALIGSICGVFSLAGHWRNRNRLYVRDIGITEKGFKFEVQNLGTESVSLEPDIIVEAFDAGLKTFSKIKQKYKIIASSNRTLSPKTPKVITAILDGNSDYPCASFWLPVIKISPTNGRPVKFRFIDFSDKTQRIGTLKWFYLKTVLKFSVKLFLKILEKTAKQSS